MKTLKSTALAITIIVITGIIISGCGKNETKNNVSEKNVSKQDTQKILIEEKNQKTEKSDDMKDMVKDTKNDKNIEHTMIKIPSAQCEMCEKNLNKALKKLTGVDKYKVDIEGKVIHINYDKNVTKIENAITSAGYDANDKKANPEAYNNLDKCCKKPEDR